MCLEKRSEKKLGRVGSCLKKIQVQKSVQNYGHLVDKGKLSEMQERSTFVQSSTVEIKSASRTSAK